MSFRRRLYLTIIVLFILVMSANFVLTTLSARAHFAAQLGVLAEDAATSLAFSVSRSGQAPDPVIVESMIDAVFDSGYYLSIDYTDLNGDSIVSKKRDIAIDRVPRWFIDLVNVPLSAGDADVQSGWLRLGRLHVVAHPGYVVRDLWQSIVKLFWLYCFFLVLTHLLLGLLLHYLTRPLAKLEQQADAIANENSTWSGAYPKEVEFRRVAQAMARMTERVRNAFKQQANLIDELRHELRVDAVTKLPNRSEFDAQLESWKASDEGAGPCALYLVSMYNLQTLNQARGHQYTNELLASVAAALQARVQTYRSALVGRHSGSDFSIFVPGILAESAGELANSLYAEIKALPAMVGVEHNRIAMGASFATAGASASDLFSTADESLRRNISDASLVDVLPAREGGELKALNDWRSVLEKTIAEKHFNLVFQRVKDPKCERHYEVFCRVQHDDKPVFAASFWPLLERFGLHEAMDQSIIERTLPLLAADPNLQLSVNLTPACAVSNTFVGWLRARLSEHDSAVARRLTIELKESLFEHFDALNSNILTALADLGVKIGVDRFGFSSAVMSRLQELDLAYVKLDRRFIRNIDQEGEDRFYLKSLLSICQSGDTALIVEGIERASQLHAVNALGLDVCQGFFVEEPINEQALLAKTP